MSTGIEEISKLIDEFPKEKFDARVGSVKNPDWREISDYFTKEEIKERLGYSLDVLKELLEMGGIKTFLSEKDLKILRESLGYLNDYAGEKKKQAGTNQAAHESKVVARLVQKSEIIYGVLQTNGLLSEKHHKKASMILGELAQTNARAQDIKDEITKKLSDVTSTVFAGAFKERGDVLERERNLWIAAATILNVLLLMAFSVEFVIDKELLFPEDADFSAYFLRLSVFAPIAFLEFMIFRQLAHVSSLYHQYRFKQAVAKSIEPYKKVLENMEIGHEASAAFLISSVDKLYKPPQLGRQPSNEPNVTPQGVMNEIRSMVPKE